MQLREYQRQAVGSIYEYFGRASGNPIVAMPTGTGKSVVIAAFLESALRQYPGCRALCLTHTKVLIEQNQNKFLEYWPNAPSGIYSAGLRRKEADKPIVFGGVQTVANAVKALGKRHLLLIDECHRDQERYLRVINEMKEASPQLKVIGFSATPWLLRKGHLTEGEIFTDVCFDNTGLESFNELVRQGYLAPLVPKATRVNLDAAIANTRVQAGEYVEKDLQRNVDEEKLTRAICEEILTNAEGREHWLIFACGVEHAENIAQTLRGMGVEAAATHSRLTGAQNDETIAAFKRGELRALVNMNKLTTGFDFPAIDLIALVRPTLSSSLHVQKLGRGTRPCDGKRNCLVLDFAGNVRRLGPINDPVIPNKAGKGTGDMPVRICPECNVYNFASAKVCDACGFVFPVVSKLAQVSGSDVIVRGLEPVERTRTNHPITFVRYASHVSKEGKLSLRATYHAGMMQSFHEYLCFEHTGWVQKKAHHWWKRRAPNEVLPATVKDAVSRAERLATPKAVIVETTSANKFYSIVDYIW